MVNNQNETLKMKDDIMFKAFFGRKGNEIFLKDFLNSIFGNEIQIKNVIHDARLEQLAPKAQYSQLKKVIVIAILNFSFIKLPKYVTKTVRVADQHRDYELNNNVTYYYIELEKFRKQNPDITLPINQWLAFIDMEKGELLEMAEKENKLIKEAKEHYDALTGDAEVKRLVEIRLLSQMEEQATLETARDRGTQAGLEQGKKLMKMKMPIEQIKEITGLSEEEIRKNT